MASGIFRFLPLAGYSALIVLPVVCAAVSACTAGIAGRRGWLFGLAGGALFVIPELIHWALTTSRDQIEAYGYVPWDFLLLITPFIVTGALAGHAALWFGERLRRSG